MTDAKKAAEAIAEWLAKEIEPQRLPGRVKILLRDKLTEALEARAPRVVDESVISEAAENYMLPLRRPMMSELNAYFDEAFRAGFRKAAELNAIASVEAAWPSDAEIEEQRWEELGRIIDGSEKTGNSWTACAQWLRAEVLRRLGGK